MEERGLVSGRGGGDRLRNKVKCDVETVRFSGSTRIRCGLCVCPTATLYVVACFNRFQQRTNRNELATTTIETTGGWGGLGSPASGHQRGSLPCLPADMVPTHYSLRPTD